jgi:hypothetical protein
MRLLCDDDEDCDGCGRSRRDRLRLAGSPSLVQITIAPRKRSNWIISTRLMLGSLRNQALACDGFAAS